MTYLTNRHPLFANHRLSGRSPVRGEFIVRGWLQFAANAVPTVRGWRPSYNAASKVRGWRHSYQSLFAHCRRFGGRSPVRGEFIRG